METPAGYALSGSRHLFPATSVSGGCGFNTGLGALLFRTRGSGGGRLSFQPKRFEIAIAIVKRCHLDYSWRDGLETLAIQLLVGAGTIGGNWNANHWYHAPDDGSCTAQARGGNW